ncbi:MAG: DUF4416 family protein [bacterium]|nr:DUF4416 family protein [bacterium]
MTEPRIPPESKLFFGVLFNTEDDLLKTEKKLVGRFGEIDLRSEHMPFKHTSYYEEIGENLKKVLFTFKRFVPREDIVDIKLYANKLEKKISGSGNKRIINIDPGYITLSNVFIASCKEYYHRTYLSKGVYLENEYWYSYKKLNTWDWTYPDYKKKEYIHFFFEARELYHKQIKEYAEI